MHSLCISPVASLWQPTVAASEKDYEGEASDFNSPVGEQGDFWDWGNGMSYKPFCRKKQTCLPTKAGSHQK